MDKKTYKNIISSLFLVAMLGLVAGIVLLYTEIQSLLVMNNQMIQSYQTIRATNRTTVAITDAALRISIFSNTHDRDIIKKLPETIISAKLNLSTLADLIQDNEIQRNLFLELLPLFNKKIEFLNTYVAQVLSTNMNVAPPPFSDKNRIELTYKINELIDEIRVQEIIQLNTFSKEFSMGEKRTYKFFMVGSILLFSLLLLGFMALNNYFKKY